MAVPPVAALRLTTACDCVVNRVANGDGHYAENPCECERETKQFQHSEYGLRAQSDSLSFHQNDGADAGLR